MLKIAHNMALDVTSKNHETIKDNLNAFLANFDSIKIERADYGSGYYVYVPKDNPDYIQFCYDINYLNGWLYGCVQAVNRKELTQKTMEVE